MTTFYPITYKLQVRQSNPYDAAEGFQLILLQVEENRPMFLWADSTVANCKTKAAGIFTAATSGMVATSPSNATLLSSSGLVWLGDVSNGTNSVPNGADLRWADAILVF